MADWRPTDEPVVTMSAEARVAVVTGGGSGLGAAISVRLAREGHRVVVADINEVSSQQTVEAIVAKHANGEGSTGARLIADPMTVDVRSEGEVAAMVDAVVERHGRLDVLVCSAAIETRSSVVDCSDDDWHRVLDVNLKGPFLCMKHAIPAMIRGGHGSVVLMGSVLGSIGAPGYAAYCASKGALVNLAKQAAIEHAPDGVRVNVVSPSATDTGLFMQVAAQAPDPDAIITMVASRNPMGRLGTAAEVCDAVAFLASDHSTYISGTVLALDGAMAARRS
jgi:NAD(P)-dependent dehydrogenase (short-subunit alcohol dehydrogenase family)